MSVQNKPSKIIELEPAEFSKLINRIKELEKENEELRNIIDFLNKEIQEFNEFNKTNKNK